MIRFYFYYKTTKLYIRVSDIHGNKKAFSTGISISKDSLLKDLQLTTDSKVNADIIR